MAPKYFLECLSYAEGVNIGVFVICTSCLAGGHTAQTQYMFAIHMPATSNAKSRIEQGNAITSTLMEITAAS